MQTQPIVEAKDHAPKIQPQRRDVTLLPDRRVVCGRANMKDPFEEAHVRHL